MSYCVNCGVELEKSLSKCPLCDTPVINPNVSDTEKPVPAFPERIVLPTATKNKFSAIIVSLLILIPNIVCVITNLLFNPDILWSIYVVSSSAIFWFLFVFPFIMKSKHKYLTIAIDAIATAAYVFVFYYYNSAQTGWFWSLAIPLDIGIFACVAVLTAYFSKKRTLTQNLIAVFSALTFVSAYIGVLVNLYSSSVITTYVTMIFGISSLILLLFFVAAEKNVKLKAWLTRKFFF